MFIHNWERVMDCICQSLDYLTDLHTDTDSYTDSDDSNAYTTHN